MRSQCTQFNSASVSAKWRWSLLGVVVLLCFTQVSYANLITNSGFEFGLTGWTTWGSTNTATTAQKYSGSYSCLSSNRSQTWQGPVQSLLGLLTPGVTYRISGWVRLETVAADKVEILMQYNDNNGDHYQGSGPVLVSNDAWTPIVMYYNAPTPVGTLNSMNLYVCGPAIGVNFYLDDVFVEQWSGYTTQQVNVDLSVNSGNVTYRASGFLHGLSGTDPGTSVFEPLKPRLYRFDPALTGGWGPGLNDTTYMNRVASVGSRRQLIVSDEYGYGYNPAGWPGDDGTADQALRDTITSIYNSIVANGYTGIEWDIWNEPDYADPDPANLFFWKASQAQFFKAWKVAHIKIRQLDPAAVIVGPSIAFFSPNGNPGQYLKDFLIYCRDNNCLPSVLSWHEMSSYREVNAQVKLMRQFMADNGITEIPIDLNEYISEYLTPKPGAYPWFYAALEQAAVKGAAHACWNDNTGESTATVGRLDGLTSKLNHLPLAVWHVNKAYADMSGNLCKVNGGVTIGGLASKNSTSGQVKMVLGNEAGELNYANLVIDRLDQISYFPSSGETRVVIQKVADNGWNEVFAPTAVSDTVYQPSGTSLSLSLSMGAYESFFVTLSDTGKRILFTDGFESGNFTTGSWTTQNSNATVTTAAKYTGTYGAKLAKATWIQKTRSTAGYNTIKVKCNVRTYGMSGSEYLFVEWSTDGTTWYSLENNLRPTSWTAKEYTCATGANNNANFRIRFRTNGSTTSKYAYVDDVVITGMMQ